MGYAVSLCPPMSQRVRGWRDAQERDWGLERVGNFPTGRFAVGKGQFIEIDAFHKNVDIDKILMGTRKVSCQLAW